MRPLVRTWRAIRSDHQAATMIEYAIMGAIIAAALVTATPLLTTAVNSSFVTMASKVYGS